MTILPTAEFAATVSALSHRVASHRQARIVFAAAAVTVALAVPSFSPAHAVTIIQPDGSYTQPATPAYNWSPPLAAATTPTADLSAAGLSGRASTNLSGASRLHRS
jgi:hypothetical protein